MYKLKIDNKTIFFNQLGFLDGYIIKYLLEPHQDNVEAIKINLIKDNVTEATISELLYNSDKVSNKNLQKAIDEYCLKNNLDSKTVTLGELGIRCG